MQSARDSSREQRMSGMWLFGCRKASWSLPPRLALCVSCSVLTPEKVPAPYQGIIFTKQYEIVIEILLSHIVSKPRCIMLRRDKHLLR